MNDFSIRVKGMPHDNQYGCEDSTLRAYLIHHFESIIKDEIEKKKAQPKEEEEEKKDFDQIPQQSTNPNAPVSHDYEIADIEFGKSDMFEIGFLNELSVIRQQFLTNNSQIEKFESKMEDAAAEKLKTKNDQLQKKWSTVLDKMIAEKEAKKEKADLEDSTQTTVRFAYIVFRSMDAMDHVFNAYKVGRCKRCCIMRCGCCCKEKQAELKKKHFFKRWPNIEVACEPDNIKWFNLGTNARSRRARAALIWFIAILLIIASLIGIVFMKEKTDELK